MNCARFNFSHGTHEEQLRKIQTVKEVREELGLPIAILLDTKGPEIRFRDFVSPHLDFITYCNIHFSKNRTANELAEARKYSIRSPLEDEFPENLLFNCSYILTYLDRDCKQMFEIDKMGNN